MSLSSLRRLCVLGVLALLSLGIAGCDLGSTPPTPAATLAPATTGTQQTAPATPAATQQAVAPTDTAAASSPVPTLTGDNQIDNTKLYHDSRNPQFRSPVAAVPAGADVTLRLRTAPGDLTSAQVRIWNTRVETETLVPMHPTAPDMWEATVHTPAQATALYYRFIATDGTSTAYYNDDKAQDGGVGAGEGYQTDTDYVITAYDPSFKTPDWLKGGVVYQIFPDRFNNGDLSNDKPAGSFIYGGTTESRKWGDAPTGGNDFFGGDLRGVIDKLDYLKSLGVTAIYFNPIFASPSNHRYDTTDYTKIDPALGDLDTFKELVSKAKAQGIHIILDGVFNHSSSDSVYFDKYSRYPTNGAYESKSSPYFSWYTFRDWPQKYNGWQNIGTLPVYSETAAVEDFLFRAPDSVVSQWTKEGIGGWRLDAAEQKSHAYWRDFRTALKSVDPDAVILGEFWHDSSAWLAGDQWDGTMNYRFRDAVQNWLGNPLRDAGTMSNLLDAIREDYPPQALAASMNLIDSHDTARALTDLNGDKSLLRNMALMQFTWPGLPTVYYGDEAGMTGGGDPDDRRTYPWGSEDKQLIDYYSLLGKTRHASTALQSGDYVELGYDNQLDTYAYARKDTNGSAVVALTRNPGDVVLDLSMKDVAPDGTVFEDVLSGTSYTVEGGKISVKIAPKSGVLLISK